MFAGSAGAAAAWKTGRRPNAANTIPQTSPPAHVLASGLRRYAFNHSLGQEALDFLFSSAGGGVKPKPRPLQTTSVQFKANMTRLDALTSPRAARLIPELEDEERAKTMEACPRA